MDQRAHRCGTLHGIRQPDMQWELARFSSRAAEDQQRNECSACAEYGETGTFQTTVSAIVKKKCAAPAIKPQHSQEESHVADASGDECLLCSGRSARLFDPKSDEQIRREPHKLPKNEKQKQTVGDNQPEHRTGEEREVRKESGEIFVLGHVTDAEDKNAKPNQRDHHQHGGSERIKNETETQRLFAECKPREIPDRTETWCLHAYSERDH